LTGELNYSKKASMENNDLIEMGYCAKPHGIKGGFSFVLSNIEDSCLEKGVKITLFPSSKKSSLPKNGEVFTIKSISFGNKVITYLEEVFDRNRVEEIIPFTIKVSRDLFPETQEDEFYLVDLVDLEARDHESGEVLGKIKDFYDNTAQTVIVIKAPGKQVLELPLIEQFFPEINIEEGYVTVNPPTYIEGKK
jgi:16S rRNA processing protein RimM